MKYTVLYSGSSGNCAFIKIADKCILIDAGVSCKKITMGLENHRINLNQVEAIMLTHEHTDHVLGLRQLVDKHNIKLYTTRKTYYAIAGKNRPESLENIVFMEQTTLFPSLDLKVECLPISHDVVEGLYFIFYWGHVKFVYLTDSGYIPEKHHEKIMNADGYVIESNHEPELVLKSRYPWNIQHRILSDKGHLSNQDCALLLQKVVGNRTKNVILAHISEEANRPDLAYSRTREALDAIGEQKIKLAVALRDNIDFPIVELEDV
ncbi:metallo-hydrolase [Erysipelotrichaceae bacterium]|nr:metallo-hydrolase [Erysipelotrichaceae bacterium]